MPKPTLETLTLTSGAVHRPPSRPAYHLGEMLRRGKASPVSDCYLHIRLFFMAFSDDRRSYFCRIAKLGTERTILRPSPGFAGMSSLGSRLFPAPTPPGYRFDD